MAILFEHNGDWPDSDEDYWMQHENDNEDNCFFCERNGDGCVCDANHDAAQEERLLYELDDK